MKISKGFTINYTPLVISHGIMLRGTVPDEQNYSSYDGTYTPDYTSAPLSLLPWVSIMDKDGILTDGNVNASLANIKWVEVNGDKETVISNSVDGYRVTTAESELNGLLILSKNITPDSTITLKFSAQYVDTRTGQVFYINDSYLLSCYSAAPSQPTLSLSIAESNIYNPLRDTASVTIEAKLYIGEKGEAPAANRRFVWMVSNDGSTFHEAGTDALDYWCVVSDDGTYVTVDRSAMGGTAKVRCDVVYKDGGISDTDTVDSSSPSKTITLTRRIAPYEASIEGVQPRITPAATILEATCRVFDKQGEVVNYEAELMPVWKMGNAGSTGNVSSYETVGTGKTINIATDDVSTLYGAVVECELEDRGAWCAFTDSDGTVLTDSDGAVLLIH